MINYLPDPDQKSRVFSLSYSQLRDKYEELSSLRDDEFAKRLPEALHFACFVCYVKEVPTDVCLNDFGIIHMLAHLIHLPDDPTIQGEFGLMRKAFNEALKLV